MPGRRLVPFLETVEPLVSLGRPVATSGVVVACGARCGATLEPFGDTFSCGFIVSTGSATACEF